MEVHHLPVWSTIYYKHAREAIIIVHNIKEMLCPLIQHVNISSDDQRRQAVACALECKFISNL